MYGRNCRNQLGPPTQCLCKVIDRKEKSGGLNWQKSETQSRIGEKWPLKRPVRRKRNKKGKESLRSLRFDRDDRRRIVLLKLLQKIGIEVELNPDFRGR